MSDFVIGIDLGTTNTCASIFLNESIKLLENAEGKQVTPSFVFFTDIEKEEVTVGPYAKKMADIKPEFGIYEFKRLIGRNFDDDIVQNNLQYYPFTVDESEEKKCCISIEKKGETFQKSIEEITAILLRKVKDDASAKMKSRIDKAVITVPAYFNHHQREATLEAAKIAGFTVLKLLNEPTAAALSHFQERKTIDSLESYYLVYDLGGGTFDVAILKKNGNQIEIVAVDGDSHLGGHDFDVLITDYICDYLLKEHNFDAKKNKRTMKRLQTKSEEAKEALSFARETQIILEAVVAGHEVIVMTLKREQFESMALHLFEKSTEILHLCLKSADIEKNQIQDVILSGGSTRIPKIQQMITEYFDGIALNKFVNPDVCVANGASIQAALLSTNPEQKFDTMDIREVTPLSLGARDHVNRMNFVIKRNAPLPTSGQYIYCNSKNQQESMVFHIYEGERTDARKNRFLGTFKINHLTPAPPGQCAVTLSLDVDENGILTVSAKEVYRDNVKEAKINYTRGERGTTMIQNSWQDAERNRNEDAKFVKFAAQKQYLYKYCTSVKYNMEDRNLIPVNESAYELCKSTLSKVKQLELPDQLYVAELINAVELKLGPLVRYFNFQYMPVKNF